MLTIVFGTTLDDLGSALAVLGSRLEASEAGVAVRVRDPTESGVVVSPAGTCLATVRV